ncbi:MAG: hypothetical protein EYC70_10735 [Planctomycetota bacterium]|nr:MAG: hypothetical protein EYC70_10735 [Planctomycetota bacterium]
MRSFRAWPVLAALMCGCGSWSAETTAVEPLPVPILLPARISFEETPSGQLPPGWRQVQTNRGAPVTWAVMADAAAPDGKQVLKLLETRNTGNTFNLLLNSAGEWPANLELGVLLRADSGEEDQGGGLVWRAVDAANYYVTRWNPLESNLRIYTVVDGRRTMLASAHVDADARAWHALRVTALGAHMLVAFDGRTLLEVEDPTFSRSGGIGLWTKADAATSFDVLTARP